MRVDIGVLSEGLRECCLTCGAIREYIRVDVTVVKSEGLGESLLLWCHQRVKVRVDFIVVSLVVLG